jgi:hypothetical protein
MNNKKNKINNNINMKNKIIIRNNKINNYIDLCNKMLLQQIQLKLIVPQLLRLQMLKVQEQAQIHLNNNKIMYKIIKVIIR